MEMFLTESEFVSRGYRRLSDSPEVHAAVDMIAQEIARMPIHLIEDSEKGNKRIENELSKKIDIYPNKLTNRFDFMYNIVRNMYLEGKGNMVVYPEFNRQGYIENLIPFDMSKVVFQDTDDGYEVHYQGSVYNYDEVLHFSLSPDPHKPYIGLGLDRIVKDLTRSLHQASETKRIYMAGRYQPSLIISVEGDIEGMTDSEKSDAVLSEVTSNMSSGKPWIIPSGLFNVEQVKPLTLQDIAINEAVDIDKRMLASVFNVPVYRLTGEKFDERAFNHFIKTTVHRVALVIEQELTRKLLNHGYTETSGDWFFRFNQNAALSYDLETIADNLLPQYKAGILTGNEVRARLGYEPREELDELILLENFIQIDDIANQKKLDNEDKHKAKDKDEDDVSDSEGGEDN